MEAILIKIATAVLVKVGGWFFGSIVDFIGRKQVVKEAKVKVKEIGNDENPRVRAARIDDLLTK